MPNFSANDPNNPLTQLLAGRSMTGTSGFNVGGAFSTLLMGGGGYSTEGGDAAGPGRVTPEQLALMKQYGLSLDTQMESPVYSFSGKPFSLGGQEYSIDPTGDISFGGKTYSQLNNLNVGGAGGVKDASKVTYDPNFGLITDPSNVNNIFDTGYGNTVFALAALGLGAPVAAAAMGAGAAGAGDAAATAGTATSASPMVFAPGMEAQGAMESQLLNAGILPGTTEWTSALSAAGLDPTAGAGLTGTAAPGGTQAAAPVSDGSTPIPGTNPGGSNLGSAFNTFNRARSALGMANSLFGGSQGSKGMDLSSVLGLLGLGHTLLGGGVGTASGAQAAGNHAADLADPWAAMRSKFAGQLTPDAVNKLLNPDFSQISSDPAFQFARDQGINTINMGDAAQGTLRSGNRGTELQQFGSGLASQYEQQLMNNNFTKLNALSGLAGVNAGSPAAAAQMTMGGFENASNLQGAGLNGLFSGGSNNPLSGLLGMLGSAGSSLFGTNGLFSQLFGDNSGLSDSDISSLIGGVGGGTTSDDLFGGLSGFGDAFAGV